MVNNNTKSPVAKNGAGSAPVSAGVSVPVLQAGNGSNPAGNGGTAGAPATPAPIPGAKSSAKRGLQTEITRIVQGLGTQIPDGSTVLVTGSPVSKQDLIAQFVAFLALFANVDTAAQALKDQRQALTAATPSARQLLANVKAALVALFGKGNPALVAFGFSGAKPRQLTAEQKFARAAKAVATRELRGTGGKRQKAGVKFTGKIVVQANVSGTPASGGNTPAASANPGLAGAPAGGSYSPAGASPSGSNTSAS